MTGASWEGDGRTSQRKARVELNILRMTTNLTGRQRHGSCMTFLSFFRHTTNHAKIRLYPLLIQTTNPQHTLDLPMLPQPTREPSLPPLAFARNSSLQLRSTLDQIVRKNNQDRVPVEVVDAEFLESRLFGRPVGSGLGFELVVVDGFAEVLDTVEVVDRWGWKEEEGQMRR